MIMLVYLGFPHGHVSSLSVARKALDDPPHSFSWPDPLHKVGREEADSVATLALKSTGEEKKTFIWMSW